jgi:hypothetical protein
MKELYQVEVIVLTSIPNHEEPFEGQDLVKEKLREPV